MITILLNRVDLQHFAVSMKIAQYYKMPVLLCLSKLAIN